MAGVRRLGIAAVMAAAVLVGEVAEAARPVVAVFGLKAKGTRLKQRNLDRLSDYIGAALTESGRFEVVPREELKAALNRQKAQSFKQCYAQSCQIEIGKELAAEKSLAGSVSRFGNSCIVSLKLFDLAKSTQEAAGTADGKCGADAVFRSVKTALAKITGRRVGGSGTTEPAVVAPNIEGADYGDVDAEIRAASKKKAQEAAEKKAREKAASKDWKKIQKWVGNDKLDAKRRASILEKFLARFERDNPHEGQAQAMLRRLRTAGGMVRVPAGEFYMGCNVRVDSECDGDEKPGKTVHVGAFRIDTTEVTVAAYKKCVDAGACSGDVTTQFASGKKQSGSHCNWGKSGRSEHPMNCVNWAGADSFCKWAGKRLPSEKEWEKAARGTDGRKYAWGNAGFGATKVANIADRTAKSRSKLSWAVESYDDGFEATAPVGSFPAGASPYGAQDMIGNVWEWVSGWDSQERKRRSFRGGSWLAASKRARASKRRYYAPARRSAAVGFRCAQSE